MALELSQDIKNKIDKWAERYPDNQRKSCIMEALRIVQEDCSGSVNEEQMQAVAKHVGVEPIEVYEIATFYDMYELKQIGKFLICICTNVSCALCGAAKLVKWFKEEVGAGLGETSEDGMFTIKEVECMGACCGAPMCQVNNRHYYENLTQEKVKKLVAALRSGSEPLPEEI
jgi:NADH-quinone oxidoreductase subunit E